jgi:hypothetical protein
VDEKIRALTDDQLRARLTWLDRHTDDGLEYLAKTLLRLALHSEADRRRLAFPA